MDASLLTPLHFLYLGFKYTNRVQYRNYSTETLFTISENAGLAQSNKCRAWLVWFPHLQGAGTQHMSEIPAIPDEFAKIFVLFFSLRGGNNDAPCFATAHERVIPCPKAKTINLWKLEGWAFVVVVKGLNEVIS